MPPTGPNPYLRTKILTASPEELRLMLYEGALRFCHQAVETLQAKNYEGSFDALTRAQKIVMELSTSLRHNTAPELCAKLSGLYTYIYRQLVDASLKRDPALVQNAIKLLEYEKETWQLLMAKLAGERQHPGDLDRADVAGAQQTVMSSLSTRG